MNSGDCFILDLGLTIYVWNGASAGLMEKRKALDVARRIRDEERGGRAEMGVMGECTKDFSRMIRSYSGEVEQNTCTANTQTQTCD